MNYEFVATGVVLIVFAPILYMTDHTRWATLVFLLGFLTILLGRVKRASPGGMTEPHEI